MEPIIIKYKLEKLDPPLTYNADMPFTQEQKVEMCRAVCGRVMSIVDQILEQQPSLADEGPGVVIKMATEVIFQSFERFAAQRKSKGFGA